MVFQVSRPLFCSREPRGATAIARPALIVPGSAEGAALCTAFNEEDFLTQDSSHLSLLSIRVDVSSDEQGPYSTVVLISQQQISLLGFSVR